MDIKFNKGLLFLVIGLIITVWLLGFPIGAFYFNKIGGENYFKFSIQNILIFGLRNIILHFQNVVIGSWCYINVSKLKQDKLTWFVIGLIYGYYTIILLLLIIIIQNIEVQFNFSNSIKKLLILFLLTILISTSFPFFITFFLNYKIGVIANASYSVLSQVQSFLDPILLIVLNLIVTIKFAIWLRNIGETKKTVWIIATIFLGLFPIILYNSLLMIRKKISEA